MCRIKLVRKNITMIAHIINMYERDIPHVPSEVTREEFVHHVFDLGFRYYHSYSTCIGTVELGDKFVSFTGARTPHTSTLFPDNECVPQIYSLELAYITTVILAKRYEDHGYKSTKQAITDTDNSYIIKMEWEICQILNFHITINNFMTTMGELLWDGTSNVSDVNNILPWHPMFWDLSKEVCLNRSLLSARPHTLILGIMLLWNSGSLRAMRSYKQRIFRDTMMRLAYECEVPLEELLRGYITIKQVNI
jgi:hypothetical protein